ncbi:MAG TPA: methyltransferase domain-containing protein [Dehalococcoidia bacterium]|nr:methyltransferase domain-containing protein [Dehalococcoidia bacterium]
MTDHVVPANIPRDSLREQVQEKYAGLAAEPEATWHFNVGKPLAMMLGYTEAQIASVPSEIVETFAGTGNPFSFGALTPGETVLDLGCGAGFDSLLAARQVGPAGHVIAVDMTQAMLDKAQDGARQAGLANVETRLGFAESIPVAGGSVDVVISNGVINLCPDKLAVLKEVHRVLRPGGRIQIADMVVHKAIPQEVKDDIELWSG